MKYALVLLLASLAFFCGSAHAQYARADAYQTALTQIKKAMVPSTSGIGHFRLVSLRLLADPQMAPLFEALIAKGDVPMRIDGYMGMALVSADHTLDAAKVNQLKDPSLRQLLITEALGLELLKPKALLTFLSATDLTNYERALLVAEMNRQGQAWDKSLLESAPSDATLDVSGLASMLLLEQADDGGWKGFIRQCEQLDPQVRIDLLKQLANAAKQYKIVAAVAPLLAITSNSTGPDRLAAITTAVSLSPTIGRGVVLERLQAERTQSNLVPMGMLMLFAKEGFEAADFEQLRNGDPMLEAMANAGVAMRTPNADQAAALAALLDNGNRNTSDFVLSVTSKLAPEVAKGLLLHVLERAAKDSSLRNQDQIVTLLAVQQLLRIPQAHEALLKITLESLNNNKNIELAETIMAVVADSSTPEAAAFARMIRGKLPRRGESMALLALAKASVALNAAEIEELGSIASGGGNLEESSQIQAAWLCLKYMKKEKQAIAELTR